MKYPVIALISFLFHVPLMAQWTSVSSPPAFTSHHSFAFSINGTGYMVTGNTSSGASASFFSYAPDIDEWASLPDFPGGTRGYGIGEVWDNKAYFGFGSGVSPGSTSAEPKNDLWVFDPATGEWTELSSCLCSPRIHPAFVPHQGNIYVGMGSTTGVGNLNDWWQYNIATDTWTQKADLPSHGRHHPYQFAIGDYVYAGFGHGSIAPGIYNTWFQYDPANDSWLQVADIPGEGRVAGTQFSHKGYGYVLSGEGENHGSMNKGEFWRYDAQSDSWTELPPHPGASRWAPASFILDDAVYIINGTAFSDYQDETFKYKLVDSTSNTNNLNNTDFDIQIYPNPFSDQITIEVALDGSKKPADIQVKVLNVLGETMQEFMLGSSVSTQPVGQLPAGVYLMEFFVDKTKIASKKLIKHGG